jgi:hypothetical protein
LLVSTRALTGCIICLFMVLGVILIPISIIGSLPRRWVNWAARYLKFTLTFFAIRANLFRIGKMRMKHEDDEWFVSLPAVLGKLH